MSRFTSIKNAYNSRFRWLFSMDLCSACLSSLRNDFLILISLKTSRYRRKVDYKKLAPLTPTCKKGISGKTKSFSNHYQIYTFHFRTSLIEYFCPFITKTETFHDPVCKSKLDHSLIYK